MTSKYTKTIFTLTFMAMASAVFTAPSYASLVEPNYTHEKPYATTPWYESYSHDNYLADQSFITGMRPHHAGALTMSQDYLASDKKASKRMQRLAKGIIHNQKFEILMLDEVENQINSVDFSTSKDARKAQVATQGLAQRERFIRDAMPSLWGSETDVSEEDVRFAKAMIVHHEGALIMCEQYLDDPRSGNGYLELMCLDILRDQAQEIALMRDIISDYPGNPDDVKIKPSMVHGMDGMMHGGMMGDKMKGEHKMSHDDHGQHKDHHKHH